MPKIVGPAEARRWLKQETSSISSEAAPLWVLRRPCPFFLGCPLRPEGVDSRQIPGGSSMNTLYLRSRLILVTVACLTCGLFAVAADETTLTKEQIKQFLLTAKVVHSQPAKKGVTNTLRLTLSDGAVTHDASFQGIDEHKNVKELARGTELNFVDSYKYNIAAYGLAELLGMDDMLPVYVERKVGGNTG